MGGQSYKCPLCEKWFISKGGLKDHLKNVHDISAQAQIEGMGQHTRLEEKS